MQNINNSVDNVIKYGHNAQQLSGNSLEMEGKMKRKKVSLEYKKKAVDAVNQSRETMRLPEACQANGVKVYDYYNWSKRLLQLSARKRLNKSPRAFIIRRKPVAQTVAAAGSPNNTGGSPKLSGKCAVILADASDLPQVLQELNLTP